MCFPEGSTCTRCQEAITDANRGCCHVPHPEHKLVDAGSMFGAGCSSWSYACSACGESFTKKSTSRSGIGKKSDAKIADGPKWCYSGHHMIKPLKYSDERRVRKDVLSLTVGPDIQERIDEIPAKMPDIRVLTIQSDGCFDDNIQPKLRIRMPQLAELRLTDVCFSQVTLTTELTPNLEELHMQNIPCECRLSVVLPALKDFSMHYYDPPDDDTWIHKMLASAQNLVSFDSYKLRVGPELRFAGNDLRRIRLHRAEMLCSLSVYAPGLESLVLQGCYGLDGELEIIDRHPDFEAPSGRPSAFEVNTTNACISPSIANTLKTNPRVLWDGEDKDDEYGGGSGNPCEGMFAQMYSQMGSEH